MTIKNFFSLILLGFIAISGHAAQAQTQDIYVEPLFVDDEHKYVPFPAADIEAKKIEALQNKDVEAMYIIGMMYVDGKNVDDDMVQAVEWLKNAARLGNSDAMLELAKIFSLGQEFTGFERNQNEAEKYIREAVKRNNPKAFYALGIMHEDGFPVERSFEKAFENYRKAALRGILNAYVKMYLAYQYGKGTDPDLKRAIYWLRKIQTEAPEGKVKEYSKQMLSDIYFELALTEADPALKFRLFNLSWSNGNKFALEAIGDMFQSGQGVKQSHTSAIVAYETAIKNYESVYAMERLGFIYMKGPAEIRKDYPKAIELFKKASDLGGVTAAYMMGYMNFYGLGMAQDRQEANKWFDRSKQLATRRRQDLLQARQRDTGPSAALQNILKSVSDREEERLKTMDEQLNKPQGQGMPQLPDISQY